MSSTFPVLSVKNGHQANLTGSVMNGRVWVRGSFVLVNAVADPGFGQGGGAQLAECRYLQTERSEVANVSHICTRNVLR